MGLNDVLVNICRMVMKKSSFFMLNVVRLSSVMEFGERKEHNLSFLGNL